MKYAFIALIACYLLVYGCGPDNSKKVEDKKGQTVHSSVEKPLQPAPAAQPQETGKQPVAAVSATPQPAQQTAPEPPPQAASAANDQQAPVVAEQQKTGEAAEVLPQTPCKMMPHQRGAVELTQPDEENIVVMPCGCMFVNHQALENAPCLKGSIPPPCPMMGEKQPAAEDELIMMPCGRVFMRQSMPPADDPCLGQQQTETPGQTEAQTQIAVESAQDLASVVQKLVEATNDMLQVTQQLVVATEEMLKATQEKAGGVATPNSDKLQTQQEVRSARQEVAADTGKPASAGEQEVVNAMKDAVIATQRALEIMNQAAPKAVEPRQ